METRRSFMTYILLGFGAFLTALLSASCGKKPDAQTEPSPEWPPKE